MDGDARLNLARAVATFLLHTPSTFSRPIEWRMKRSVMRRQKMDL